MSTIGSNPAASGTAQQDRTASSNSHQARRQSGDNQAFANLLMAAAEDQSQGQLSQSRKANEDTFQADPSNGNGNGLLAATPLSPATPLSQPVDATRVDANAASEGDTAGRSGRAKRAPTSPVAAWARDNPGVGRSLRELARGQGQPDNGASEATQNQALSTGQSQTASGAAVGTDLPLVNALAGAFEDALELSDDVTALTSAIMDRLGGRGGAASSVQETQAVNADGGGPQFESPSTPTEAPADAGTWQNAWTDAVDQMSQQVSYWLGKGVSQAQLSVPGAGGDTIEVRVQLRDGEAHLEFLASDEATRQNIVEHGIELLRDALADRGIDLGSLSVDARGSGAAGQERQVREAPAEQATQARSAAEGAPQADAPMVRIQTHSGLDIYA